MGDDEGITLGELYRAILASRTEQRAMAQDVSKMASSLSIADERIRSNTQRIQDLESSLTWAVRLVVGALILGVLGLVINAAQAVPPL